jgi:hypothetical protein
VVCFYSKRGTAEQWIKEGKQAVKMTRLSCHRFRSNEVRLWLIVIASSHKNSKIPLESFMNTVKKNFGRPLLFLIAVFMLSALWSEAKDEATSIHNNQMSVSVALQGGFYEIASGASEKPVLKAVVAAEIDHHWIKSSDYPQSKTTQSGFKNDLGSGQQLVTTYVGLADRPSLICVMRLYDELPVGDIEVRVQNSTAKQVTVQAIRVVDAIGSPRIDLGGPEEAERIMSGGFDEGQRPIYDLGEKSLYDYYIPTAERNGDAYIGVNQQLIYNRQSGQSLFLAS